MKQFIFKVPTYALKGYERFVAGINVAGTLWIVVMLLLVISDVIGRSGFNYKFTGVPFVIMMLMGRNLAGVLPTSERMADHLHVLLMNSLIGVMGRYRLRNIRIILAGEKVCPNLMSSLSP